RDDLPLVLERRLQSDELARLQGRIDWQQLFDGLGGNPLFLHRALDRLVHAFRQARDGQGPPPISLESLPATLDDLFQDIYAEIAEKEGTRYRSVEGRHKARLLQLLCLA